MADSIKVVIDGVEFVSEHRTFSSGKKGYGLYGMTQIKGKGHRISMNLIEV